LTAWPDGTTVVGTANMSYNARNHHVTGSIHVDAGALAPGKYGYWVGMENLQTPYGIEQGTAGLVCMFKVEQHQHAAGCKGWFKSQYGIGETQNAGVFLPGGGYPPLAGSFS